MSRNLTTSKCCGNIVRLSDLRGKPIEFRRYGKYAPHIGTRWDCPTCKTVYFAWWRDAIYDGNYDPRSGNEPKFVIDLAYYESFNDEHDYDGEKVMGPEFARHVCLDNAEDAQEIWGTWRDNGDV